MSELELNEAAEQDTQSNAVNHLNTQQVLREFNQRRVINRYEYLASKQSLRENPLYVDILLNQSQYEVLFQLLGLQLRLHEKGEYFYVEQMDASIVADEPDLDTSTVKLTAILLLIARYAIKNNRDFVFFKTAGSGLLDKELADITSGDNAHIIRTLKFKDVDAIKSELVNRGFAYRKTDGLVLTQGAVNLMDEIVIQHKVAE